MNIELDFDSQGYVLLKNYFCKEEIKILKSALKYLQELPEIINGPMKYFEVLEDNSVILNRVEKFFDYAPLVRDIFVGERILNTIQNLTKRNFVLFKEKINFKLAKAGGFKPHQDGAAFRRFVDDLLITAMVVVNKATAKNGCIKILQDNYERKLIQHQNGYILAYGDVEQHSWIDVEMCPGDLLLFSSYLIHCSLDNLSDYPRSSYFITYSPQDYGDQRDKYFDFKRNKFPPRIERGNDEDYSEWVQNLARKII